MDDRYHNQYSEDQPPPIYPPPPPHFNSSNNQYSDDQPPAIYPPPNFHPPPPHYNSSYENQPTPPPPGHRPHMPGFIEGHNHQGEGGSGPDLSNKPSVKVYTKAETNFSLSIREGKVVLSPSDPNDPTQHWVRDDKFGTTVKDQDGYPAFALVNKATGQAMKHSVTNNHPVQLIPYDSDALDGSILWTFGKDLGSGYRQIRMVNNTSLVVDAFNGAKKHGGVRDGTPIMLWAPGKGDNQRWRITPY